MNIALIAHDKMKDTMIGFCIAYEKISRIAECLNISVNHLSF